MHLIALIDLLAAATLLVWLYLTLGHGRFWYPAERDITPLAVPPTWPDVAIVVPARDEAALIAEPVRSLLGQNYPGAVRLVVVDDNSADGTAAVVRGVARELGAEDRISVVLGLPLPPGWTGKLWALHQGVAQAEDGFAPKYLLLTDADTVHAPDCLVWLVAKAEREALALVSLITKPRCESLAERTLVPAFIFFFQKMFPPAWVNRRDRRTAAAVGSCMLVNRDGLAAAGGLSAVRRAIIDDCAIAGLLKARGPIWLGVSDRVFSIRPFPKFDDIRRMVSRYAFAQFDYSPLAVSGALAGLLLTYVAPPLTAIAGTGLAAWAGLTAWGLMALVFQPTLRQYRRSPLWGLALPAIAMCFMAFTLDSVYQTWRGRGGNWKGRFQASVSSSQ